MTVKLSEPHRRGLLAGGAALAAVPSLAPARAAPSPRWRALAEDVRAQMAWSWDWYRKLAWGKDEILPVSGGVRAYPMKTHHLGLSLVESLDTLWVMGLDSRFQEGVDWVKSDFTSDVDGRLSVFETSIRLVGGLLSAHHACGDPVLLEKAHELAGRLLPAFDTPTGLPYGFINPKTGERSEPHTNPASCATYLTEWGMLSRLTGDRRFHDAAKRATVAVFERRSKIDLVATGLDAETGRWLTRRATVGSYCDSFFEYLWDSWQLLGDADCKHMYDVCTAAILKHQQEVVDGDLWIRDVDFETGELIDRRQDELASFYGGLLAQGGAPRQGAAYTQAWAKVQDRFGILPEEYDYGTRRATQVTNELRPELADSAFNLWLLDGEERWRELAARHFAAMKRWNKARYGYTDMADVTSDPKRQADHCPGYWWSEQMKYYWLIFSDTPRFDYRTNYLTTEGNVLLGFKRGVARA